MPPIFKDQLLLLAVGAMLFFTNLGAAPLWDRDEPRNAGCTAEMLARGEFVVPVFNNELRTHKPILLYWLMMATYSVFGVNEFGARAVSSCLGMGTVLLTYSLARCLFDRHVARWSGLVLSSTLMFSVASRAATPDGLLIFCSTLAIYLFVRGSFARGEDRLMPTGKFLYGMYAAMGLGLLAKGPVGLVVPTAVIGMYLLIMRLPEMPAAATRGQAILRMFRPFAPLHFLKTCWSMRPLTALATAGIVAVPWYVWVHVRTDGVWTHEFFWLHNVSRASATMEGHAGPPILFYVVAILVGFFPWSILAIPTWLKIVGEQKTPLGYRAFVLLACWIAVYVGIFSIAQTKLPSYVTPCYPAIAVMVGYFMSNWNTQATKEMKWVKVGLVHWCVVGIALLVGLPIAANRWLPGSEWLGVIGCVPLLGAFVCWRLLNADRRQQTAICFGGTSIAFVGLMMALVPAEIGRHRNDASLFAELGRHRGPVVAFGHLEPSWIFYGGKPIREFKVEEEAELAAYLDEHRDAMLLTTDRRMEPLTKRVAIVANYKVIHQTDYFLRDRSLLLLKSAAEASRIANRPVSHAAEVRRPY